MKGVWGLFPYVTIDYKAAQAWLEKKGGQGLRLTGIYLQCLARFVREDAPVSYYVDVDGGEGEDYLQLCGDAGWAHVGTVRKMTVFASKPGKRPAPIQTDPALEERRFGRKYLRGVLLGDLAAVLLLAVFLGLSVLLNSTGFSGTPRLTEFFIKNSMLVLAVMAPISVLVLLWEEPATIAYWRRSRRAVAEGREMPVPGPSWARVRGIVALLPTMLGTLYLLSLVLELVGGLTVMQREYELDLENTPRSAYSAYPMLMPEDVGLEAGNMVTLRVTNSLLVPEFFQYSELTERGDVLCFFKTDRYRCRWEWTAKLLVRAARWEAANLDVDVIYRKLAFSPADLGFDEAWATAGGTHLLIRQGNTVALVGGGGADLTAPEALETVRERLQLAAEEAKTDTPVGMESAK